MKNATRLDHGGNGDGFKAFLWFHCNFYCILIYFRLVIIKILIYSKN